MLCISVHRDVWHSEEEWPTPGSSFKVSTLSVTSINTLKSSMEEILSSCQERLSAGENHLQLQVMNPSPWALQGPFPGEPVGEDQLPFRGLKTWCELAEVLSCRMGIPKEEGNHLLIDFFALRGEAWRGQEEEKQAYAPQSTYGFILKTEDPHWLHDYQLALQQCNLQKGFRILSMGVNRGDELTIMKSWYPQLFSSFHFTGFDLSGEALELANHQLASDQHRFDKRDLNEAPPTDLMPQDLMISLSTLQCSNMDGKKVFRDWFQKTLSPSGHVILGFPNCSWQDGEVIYGARMRNQPHPDPSLLMKDLMYYRKYLQTHGKRVSILGKHYLFIVGSAI